MKFIKDLELISKLTPINFTKINKKYTLELNKVF